MRRFVAFCLLLAVLTISSCSDGFSPENNSSEQEAGLFDYSKMGGHPRLLLRMEDFARMQVAKDTDTRLAAVHKAIIDRADYHIEQGPVTY